jgi:hypothetical protein
VALILIGAAAGAGIAGALHAADPGAFPERLLWCAALSGILWPFAVSNWSQPGVRNIAVFTAATFVSLAYAPPFAMLAVWVVVMVAAWLVDAARRAPKVK